MLTEGERRSSGMAGIGFEDLALSSIRAADVLFKTPSRFSVMLPNSDRLFVSRSPFFFQDNSRTFLIVPRGKYSGGPGGPTDKLSRAFNTTPLELPDIISSEVITALASNKRTASSRELSGATSSPAAGEQLAVRRASPILAAQMNTRQFMPLHWEAKSFRFENHYHPYVSLLIEQLNRHGLKGILKPDSRDRASPSRLTKDLASAVARQVFLGRVSTEPEGR